MSIFDYILAAIAILGIVIAAAMVVAFAVFVTYIQATE